jgi:uncharacterized cofD-like protein
MKKLKVVVIGGGTGTYGVLRGLKIFPQLQLSVIVGMTDDGGSNRMVRDEFGLLPLSDVRKSIIALADEDKNLLLRQLFTYRFSEGKGFDGHTLGNIIMIALSRITGSEIEAIKAINEIFDINGKVVPVTLDDSQLCAKYSDGKVNEGEHLIDDDNGEADAKITKLYLKPEAHANPEAVKEIAKADYIIMGPGDLYTTTLANVIVEGIPEAIKKSSGKFIFISNLMTKQGETHWMKQSDLINEIVAYTARKPDKILINTSAYSTDVLERYKKKHEHPIENDLFDGCYQNSVVMGDFVSTEVSEQEKGDKLPRSYIRHDPYKLGYVLYGIMNGYSQ